MQGVLKVAPEKGAVEIRELAEPTIGPEDVLVAVETAGLCGSDAGIYRYKPAYHGMELPVVIGHEYAGTVVEVGERVDAYESGDRVVEQPVRTCGTCYQCRRGLGNTCRNARIAGVHHDGAYAERISVPAGSLHPLPDGMSLRDAAITEPTSVAARAVIRNSRVQPGDDVLVAGPGPIGLLAAQVAAAQGGDVTVTGVGRDAQYRLPLAADLGVDTANVERTDVTAIVDAKTDGLGFDVVFDTTGHPSGIRSAARAVRKAGQIVVVGLPDEAQLDFTPLVRGEVDLQCSYASTWDDFDRAIDLLRTGGVDTETFVDDRFSIREPRDAFEAFLSGETCKPVFDIASLRE
jgi:2-desacetyl-2-hydroxyethyl bacteriochlorophyllide A dehydrogenase